MPKIDRILAYVVADSEPDDEGIPAFQAPDGSWMPMLGADEDRVRSLRAHAQATADSMGKPIRLLRFTHVEVVEVIEPRGLGETPGSSDGSVS